MPSHEKEIPLLKRVAILTLHWYGDKNWIEISTLLKVHPETARAICVRAKERAKNPNDFDDVLQHLGSLERHSQHTSQSKEQRHAVARSAESKEVDIPRRPSQSTDEHKNHHRVQRPAGVKHKSSNVSNVSNTTNASIESKELEILEEDLSLAGNGFVSCNGSLEGVTMMRDMDWR